MNFLSTLPTLILVLSILVTPINCFMYKQPKTLAELKIERIASIKMEILKKLDMTEPPKIKKQEIDLPDIVNEELEIQDKTSPHEYPSDSMARTEEIITLPLPKKSSFGHDDVLKFKFSEAMNTISVQKSYIQLHISRIINSTGEGTAYLTLYDITTKTNIRSRGALIITQPIDLSTLSIDGRWIRLNIKRHVKHYLSLRRRRANHNNPLRKPFTIRVDADFPLIVNMPSFNKHESRLRPVVVTKPKDFHSRRKRSVGSCNVFYNSNKPNNCCRLPMVINFKEMGWDNWIIRPSSYEAGTCSGECNFQVTRTDILPHIRQLSRPRENSRNQPCCSARDTTALKLVYYSVNFEIKVTHISNMIVNTCGCS